MKRAADIALMVAFSWAILAGIVARLTVDSFWLGWNAIAQALEVT